jgi:deoxyribonuclease IV
MLIGAHVSTAGGLVNALERAEAMGAETMQIFHQSPRAWRPTAYTQKDFAAFRERLAASKVESVYIHAVYLINVASNDAEVRRKSLSSLVHALQLGDGIGAGGVVFHPGSGKGLRAVSRSLKMIAGAAGKALAATERCPLLLENTAGAGGTIGRSFEELGDLLGLIDDPRVGVCLDSCHLLASGYDIRTPAGMSAVTDQCAARMDLDQVRALHLNDSQAKLGANVDRHANLGEGELGRKGIRAFLGEPRLQGRPVLIEVPGPDGHGPDKPQVQIAKRLRPKPGA